MRARLKWLIGGFAIVLAALILGLMLRQSRMAAPGHASRPAICEIGEICDVPLPPPVTLHRALLAREDPDRRLVAQAAGAGTIEAYLPTALFPEPPRLFLVGGSALVVVRDAPGGRQALLLRRGAGLAGLFLRTDADLALARFALLDPASSSGDTFVLQQAPDGHGFGYRAVAPDSREMREEWLASRRSTCGGGPLTAVPVQWRRAYDAICQAGEAP